MSLSLCSSEPKNPVPSGAPTSVLYEPPARQVVHRERRSVGGQLDEMSRLAVGLGIEILVAQSPDDALDQRAHHRPLDAGPVSDLVRQRLVVLLHQLPGRAEPLAAPPRGQEQV